MRKLLVIFAVLCLFPLISGIEISSKTDFDKGETFMMKISGNFFEPIANDDISFYRGHVKTSIVPSVFEINNDFYIYAQLYGKEPDNYSVVIKNAKYFDVTQLVEKDIEFNFSIGNGSADFYVEPGVVSSSGDFSLDVQNIVNKQVSLNVDSGNYSDLISPDVSSLNLKSGEKREIKFSVEDNSNNSLALVKLSSENTEYEIPVYLTLLGGSKADKISFDFEPSIIDVIIATDSESDGVISLKNKGSETLENVTISVSPSLSRYLSLSEYEIDEIKGNSTRRINVHFSSGSEPLNLEGQIVANFEDRYYSYIPVSLKFLPDYIPADANGTVKANFSQSCKQAGGNLCPEGQICSGDTKNTIDGVCCLDICSGVKTSQKGKLIGWVIIVTIVALVLWFYFKKYRKQENSPKLPFLRKK